MTAPHTYIDGRLVWAKDHPNEAIREDPYLLLGPQDLPARIWWNDRALDIVEYTHRPGQEMAEVCMITHQIGHAFGGRQGFLTRLKVDRKAIAGLRKAELWHKRASVHKLFPDHPFTIPSSRGASLVAVRWLPCLLDYIDDEDAWLSLIHISEPTRPY